MFYDRFSNGWSPEQNSSFGGFNSFSQKPGKGEEFTFDEIKEMLGYFIKVKLKSNSEPLISLMLNNRERRM